MSVIGDLAAAATVTRWGLRPRGDHGTAKDVAVAVDAEPERRRNCRDPVGYPSAGLIVVVPVVAVRMVICGSSALTGRISRHSTAGLAVVATATLVPAQLD
jgi:hypothetical protein